MPDMRFVTYNLQGLNEAGADGGKWVNAIAKMLNENIDYMCIQECGDITQAIITPYSCTNLSPPNTLYNPICYSWNRGTQDRPKLSFITYVKWGNKLRCHLSIISKNEPKSMICLNNPKNINQRPCLGIDTGLGYYIFTIHAFSGVTVNQTDIYGTITNIMTYCGTNNWFLLGDFNLTPSELTGNANWANIIRGNPIVAIDPLRPTQQWGAILDYAIFKKIPAPSYEFKVLDTIYKSDHFPVEFVFRL